MAVSRYSGLSTSNVAVNSSSRSPADGIASVAPSRSQNRMASSRCAVVRAIPRQAQRTVVAPAVPRIARCTGDAPTRRRPSSNSSSTVGASRSSTEASPRDRPPADSATIAGRVAVAVEAVVAGPSAAPGSRVARALCCWPTCRSPSLAVSVSWTGTGPAAGIAAGAAMSRGFASRAAQPTSTSSRAVPTKATRPASAACCRRLGGSRQRPGWSTARGAGFTTLTRNLAGSVSHGRLPELRVGCSR